MEIICDYDIDIIACVMYTTDIQYNKMKGDNYYGKQKNIEADSYGDRRLLSGSLRI